MSVSGSSSSPDSSTTRLPAGSPWNPTLLFACTYFISTIGSGILLGLNWKRLGKPQWAARTIIAAILVPIGCIALIIGIISLAQGSRELAPLIMVGALGIFGINFGLVGMLTYLQYSPYQKWKKHGDIAGMLAHEYNFNKARLIYGAVIVLCAILGYGFTLLD